MNQSPKLLLFVFSLCLLLIIGVLYSKDRGSQVNQTTAEQKQIFDVASGDTNEETLRTIAARQDLLEKENETLKAKHEKIEHEHEIKRKQVEDSLKKSFMDKIAAVKDELSQLSVKRDHDHALKKESLNEDNRSGYQVGGFSQHSQTIGDVTDLSHHTFSLASGGDVSHQPDRDLPHHFQPRSENQAAREPIPFYTIPANATLNHTALMTSLIAEVPISDRLLEPAFPFKAIIGKQDLFVANGMTLPEAVSGMVLEGYSVGNMTLSCARGYVTRVLFVFNDGHFTVYPDKKHDENATDLFPKNALGYLSDQYGNPCIAGQYITDAPQVITNLSLMDGLSHAGQGFAQMQTQTLQNAFQSSTKVVGSVSQYIGGHFVSGATGAAKDWYKKRVSDIFDAVVIPATTKDKKTGHVSVTELTFNVTQTIPIDLNKNGRRLRYDNIIQNKTVVRDLD